MVPLLEKVLRALELPFFKPEECRYFHDVVVQLIRCEIEKSLYHITTRYTVCNFPSPTCDIIRTLKYFLEDDETS